VVNFGATILRHESFRDISLLQWDDIDHHVIVRTRMNEFYLVFHWAISSFKPIYFLGGQMGNEQNPPEMESSMTQDFSPCLWMLAVQISRSQDEFYISLKNIIIISI
jgi:hypothetical protein